MGKGRAYPLKDVRVGNDWIDITEGELTILWNDYWRYEWSAKATMDGAHPLNEVDAVPVAFVAVGDLPFSGLASVTTSIDAGPFGVRTRIKIMGTGELEGVPDRP